MADPPVPSRPSPDAAGGLRALASARRPPSFGDASGQACSEYLAVLAVLALVLGGAATTAASLAPGVANGVVGGVRRALCAVGGLTCPVARDEPCVVASKQEGRTITAHIVLLRLDDDRSVLREQLSDGGVRLTVVETSKGGAEITLGPEGRVRLGERQVAAGGSVEAALLALAGDGRVFHASSAAAADRLLRDLARTETPLAIDRPYRILRELVSDSGPRPDEVFLEGGIEGIVGGSVAAGSLEAQLGGGGDNVVGGRLDRRTGERTVYVRAGRTGSALVAAAVGEAGLEGGGETLLGFTFGRDRRLARLTVQGTATLSGSFAPPAAIARAVGPGLGAARRLEVEARADLADPHLRAAVGAWHARPSAASAVALGRALAHRARVDVRAFATKDDSTGYEARAGLAGRLGLAVTETTETARLLAAATRPPGGLWERHLDCLAAA